MHRLGNRLGDERGVTFIFLSLSLLTLLSLGAFVLDYGVFWVSRRQAQNAADAGALAAASSLVYDSSQWPFAAATESATAAVTANSVFGLPPVPTVNMFGPFPASAICAGLTGRLECVEVDVVRNDLPVYFARLFNVFSQQVQASATAKVNIANATRCLKPWALLWNPSNFALPSSAWSYPDGIGTPVFLDPTVVDPSAPGFYLDLNLGDPTTAIETCEPTEFQITQEVTFLPGHTTLAATAAATTALISSDAGATWSASPAEQITGSCAPFGCGVPLQVQSPRIVPLAFVNQADYLGGLNPLPIANFLSLFVVNVCTTVPTCVFGGVAGGTYNYGEVGGVIVGGAGDWINGVPTVTDGQTFLRSVTLIR